MTTPAASLHVLLARDAPVGVVIRRGPSRWSATVFWDRTTDRFTVGQWLHGRIYGDRSDLSTDGKYLVYFALNGKWNSESRGSWTAVSHAPYLKALALLPHGDTWGGGGVWTGPDTYVGTVAGLAEINGLDGDLLRRDDGYVPPTDEHGQFLHGRRACWIRDGWSCVSHRAADAWADAGSFQKPLPHGWTLVRTAAQHAMVHRAAGTAISRPGWSWADRDGDRLVWAAAGVLYAGRVTPDGLADERPLFDFNPMTFERIGAPY